MAIIRNVVVKIAADISALQQGLNKAQGHLNKVSRQFTDIGRTLTAGITVPLAGMGAVALKTAADFEQSMANAASVSGATADEFEKMKKIARAMGQSTVFSASEAADAMYYMASAGYKAEQMARSIKPTLDLAAATQSSLAFSTDMVIASLNQFGLGAEEAQRVTNVFAAAIGSSQATLDKLSNSMRYVGPVANSLGYSIEQATAALSLLYNAGFQGEQAGTILRGALSRLMKPTREVTKALAEMGVSYGQINPATKSLADIVKVLGDKSITTAQAVRIFGKEAGPGMMALISQGSDALLDMEKKITGTNAAAVMAQKQLDTFKGSMKLLKSALQEVAIQFGNILIPILRNLVTKYIQPAVAWFSNLNEGIKKTIVVIALLAAAIGPLFLLIGGILKILSATAGVLSMLSGPVGIVVAAIAALAVTIKYLMDTNEEFKRTVIAAWENVKMAIGSAVEKILTWWGRYQKEVLNTLTNLFLAIKTVADFVFKELWQSLQLFFNQVKPLWEDIKTLFLSLGEVFMQMWQLLKPVLKALGEITLGLFGVFTGVINGIIRALAPFIKTVIKALETIINVTGLVIALLRGDWTKAWAYFKAAALSAWEVIKGIFLTIKSFVKGFVDGVISFFKGLWYALVGGSIIPDIVYGALKWFKYMLTGITQTIGNITNAVKEAFNNIFGYIGTVIKDARQWGVNLINNLASGIKSGLSAVSRAAQEVAGKIKDFVGFHSPAKEGPGRNADKWAPNLVGMYAKGIRAGIPEISSAITDLAGVLGSLQVKAVPGIGLTSAPAATGPTTINLNFTGPISVRDESDIKTISKELFGLIQSAQRSAGRR